MYNLCFTSYETYSPGCRYLSDQMQYITFMSLGLCAQDRYDLIEDYAIKISEKLLNGPENTPLTSPISLLGAVALEQSQVLSK